MATVGFMGPYPHSEPLGPGESRWIYFPDSEGFEFAALAVTATAHKGYPTGEGYQHVLKVDNVNITGIEKPLDVGTKAGAVTSRYSAGCNVTNNGDTTITHWSVSVGVIVP
jgi:hypothetical protein